MSQSDVASCQYRSVSGKNSHAVARVANVRPYIVAILAFGSDLLTRFTRQTAGLRNGHTAPRGGGEPYHISYGDLSPGLPVVAVQLRAWHAHDAASAHNIR